MVFSSLITCTSVHSITMEPLNTYGKEVSCFQECDLIKGVLILIELVPLYDLCLFLFTPDLV